MEHARRRVVAHGKEMGMEKATPGLGIPGRPKNDQAAQGQRTKMGKKASTLRKTNAGGMDLVHGRESERDTRPMKAGGRGAYIREALVL